MTDLVINTPSMQSLWQRYSSIVFTFVFWIIWFFLWIPVVTGLAWYLGFDLVYFEMFEQEGYKVVLFDFFRFLMVVAFLGGALAIWAAYNYFRFRGKDRRKVQSPVPMKEMADFFEVEQALVERFQRVKSVSVSFDNAGKITGIQKQG